LILFAFQNNMPNQVLAHAREHRAEYLNDLLEYLAIPSISAQPDHARDVKMAALWLAEHMRDVGINADVMDTKGHPVVYGEWKSQHPQALTVLIYGHYDVQPADPFELWTSDPFKPEIRDGFIYARGADDNKGQHLAHIKAVESYLKCEGTLPVNVKFLIEGEEEIGSMNLGEFIASHKDLLACDCAMVSDGSLFGPGQPSMTYGLRGLLDLEIHVRALDRDVHSGHYGGNVQNPAFALAQLLSTVKDEHGHVLIEGFYDDVRPLSETEREEIARVPWGEADIRRETGALMALGDPDFTPNERKGARPTFEINGMWSGYTGAGSKTIIPATAHAKITCRLVPHQDPKKVGEAVKAHLLKHAPAGVSVNIEVRRGSPASLVDRESSQVQAAVKAAKETYGNAPYFELEGGSIPVVHDFITQLQKPVVLLGFGLPDDAIHSPNERYAVECYEKGIEASIRFLSEL
jgi:acetylornithine deacetylase/succinyl-diaminopimelate desuccinylase-like protein